MNGVLATYSYTPTGQRASVTYGNGTTRSYAYDPAEITVTEITVTVHLIRNLHENLPDRSKQRRL